MPVRRWGRLKGYAEGGDLGKKVCSEEMPPGGVCRRVVVQPGVRLSFSAHARA